MIAEQVMSQEDIQWVRNTFECADLMMEKMKSLPSDVHELLLNILKQAARNVAAAAQPGHPVAATGQKVVRDVEMWVHGYYRLTPREWAGLQIKLAQMKDPQYELYQQLKEKFEGGKRRDKDTPREVYGQVCKSCIVKLGFKPHDLPSHGTCCLCKKNYKSDAVYGVIDGDMVEMMDKLDLKPCGVYGCKIIVPKANFCCSECSHIK